MNKPKRLALLGSGEGTNIQSIIDSCKDISFPAIPALIISNKESSGVIQRARNQNIPWYVLQ